MFMGSGDSFLSLSVYTRVDAGADMWFGRDIPGARRINLGLDLLSYAAVVFCVRKNRDAGMPFYV